MHKLICFGLVGLLAAVIAQGGSCGSSNANSETVKDKKLAIGVWGGEHIHAVVTERGVEIEFDCAQGSISNRIALDDKGRFTVTGKFTTEHGGPVRRDEEGSGRSVQYTGAVKENELTLAISDSNTKEVIGNFTLRHGSEGRIRKCR